MFIDDFALIWTISTIFIDCATYWDLIANPLIETDNFRSVGKYADTLLGIS
jgi:hypothetical protein